MNRILLPGCTPVPLAGWLQAVGLLRLVAEQADPNARGAWCDQGFELHSRLDEAALRAFLLESYRPTPMVAPWNSGSGFYRAGNTTAFGVLERFRAAGAERLGGYRDAIEFAHGLLQRLGIDKKNLSDHKDALLAHFRSEAPAGLLPWFNAAVLLTGDEPRYPPLLGTGGNDGRLDFTINHLQRLEDLIDLESGAPTAGAAGWLDEALFAAPRPGLQKGAIGQFDPGDAGGPNASTGFEGGARINPWRFVLMMEGTLGFAAAVSRRLESSDPGGLSYPFTVRPAVAGMPGASAEEEKSARAELWLPLWEHPAGWPELRVLLAEGRARLGRHTARDGLDFARAVAALGVDRGIDAFQRYAFFMRAGKAYLATPAGRIPCRRNPAADLISQFERNGFLARVRTYPANDKLPAALRQAARRFLDALFAQTLGDSAVRIQETLAAYGALVSRLAHHEEAPPPPRLDDRWVHAADDGSLRFRVAAALAGIGQGTSAPPMAAHLYPVQLQGGGWRWVPESRDWIWKAPGLAAGMAQVLRWRALEGLRQEAWPERPFAGPATLGEGQVAAWLADPAGDSAIEALLRGLALCAMPKLEAGHDEGRLPAAWWALRALLLDPWWLHKAGLLGDQGHLPLEVRALLLLQAGQLQAAAEQAWRRLRAAGAPLPPCDAAPRLPATADRRRLLASLLLPLGGNAILPGLGRLASDADRIAMEETA